VVLLPLGRAALSLDGSPDGERSQRVLRQELVVLAVVPPILVDRPVLVLRGVRPTDDAVLVHIRLLLPPADPAPRGRGCRGLEPRGLPVTLPDLRLAADVDVALAERVHYGLPAEGVLHA